MSFLKLFLFCIFMTFQVIPSMSILPVVIWHGIDDDCCSGIPLHVETLLRQNLPSSVYVKNIMVGDNPDEDRRNGVTMKISNQIDYVCDLLSKDKNLTNGYTAIGISQGGLLFRSLVQKCGNQPPAKQLITLGGPHQGVFGIPDCSTYSSKVVIAACKTLLYLQQQFGKLWPELKGPTAFSPLMYWKFFRFFQEHYAPAEYWHDSTNEAEYRSGSMFLADINNENSINETYRQNLIKLDRLVLINFGHDETVKPNISEHFGFFTSNLDQIVNLTQTRLFEEDRIGLKTLYQNDKLTFLSLPDSGHMIFTDQWFISQIINRFIKN